MSDEASKGIPGGVMAIKDGAVYSPGPIISVDPEAERHQVLINQLDGIRLALERIATALEGRT